MTCLFKSVLSFLMVLALLTLPVPVEAEESPYDCPLMWKMRPADSALTITAVQMADPFNAQFEKFTTEICFDPEDLDNSYISANVDVTSFNSGAADRDASVQTKEWFYSKVFPTASFVSEEIHRLAEGQYEVRGMLKIKNVSAPVSLPFSLEIEQYEGGMRAYAAGKMVLPRLLFDLGTGDWADTSIIVNDVTLSVNIMAIHRQEN